MRAFYSSSLPFYGRSPNIIMTEILLTGTLSPYSINQSMSHKPRVMYQMDGDKQIFPQSLKKGEKYDTANYRREKKQNKQPLG